MKLTEKQTHIYEGLKGIGEEISSFYLDAIKIIHQNNIASQSYLLAHFAREIDGGLRDILSPLKVKEELQKDPALKDRGLVASILVALDLKLDDPFAIKYASVASKFNKYAHRRGATKKPRKLLEVIVLWEEYEDILLKLIGSFINQLRRIERITRFQKPTKQILEALKNMFDNKQIERHFYINLKSEYWLEPMFNKGFFSPESIKDEELWNQAEYLIFIAKNIKTKVFKETNAIFLVKIIEKINFHSENIQKLKNYRIWYFIFDILTELPKKYINNKIINSIPNYLNTEHENTLESLGIFKLIYSYSVEEKNSSSFKDQITKLVELVFEISNDKKFKDSSAYENDNYYPIIRAYQLKQECKKPEFYKLVAINCSNQTIYRIADYLNTFLETNNISNFLIKTIFDLNITRKHSHSIETIYSLFLQNVCVEIAQLEKNRIIEIIESFLSERYKHKHFIKLSLFLFAKTWNKTKELFFGFISKQKKDLFSEPFWRDDFYFMLDHISIHLNNLESLVIENLIEKFSENCGSYKSPEHFRLYWFSSLNDNENFEKKYSDLSLKLGANKQEIKPKLESNVTFGSTSPLSKNEILTIPILELTSFLKKFDPERGFREPCVEGLSRVLHEVIKENPSLFTDNWEMFLEVPYRHIAEIFSSLSDVWKNKQQIDWDSCIKFIYKYTSQNKFGTNDLTLPNSTYNADHYWPLREFCRLLSAGMRDDTKAFDALLLPKVEKIIFFVIEKYLKNEIPDSQKEKLGSATSVINSDTGIFIGTLFDYSLRKARLSNIAGKKRSRWSSAERNLFENLLTNRVQEIFTYLGWHRNQFYFLDFKWTQKQLITIPKLDNQTIKSYFGGHLLNNPYSKFDYRTFKNLYISAIKENWQLVDSHMIDNPIELHAAVFYIFDYEDLNEGDIITEIFKNDKIEQIRNLIHSLSFKFDEYIKELDASGKIEFRKKIYKIWQYTLTTLDKYKTLKTKEIPTIFYLIKYIDELDEESFQLIKQSSRFARNRRDLDKLIENLNRLKTKGNIIQSSIYACEIFIDSVFTDVYYASVMQKEIIEFTEYMFTLNDDRLTEYSNKICNEFAKKGEYFLLEIYENFNN
ncbi:hypothetical protein [Leeuwenhoekiella palythoae]|uniref:Uncharacterized protein n=1 Tax=Leeuwenhoekiella palythoae TaxID=573501 RepID=A0A1M5ZSS7_9FLAO|nr:hypothetical protein [Leeuwenhoekiella palythoae]SHI27218.1 hypothetical protein SAMN04487999_3449 [Leeuwenhoekiella palythoae]